MRTTGQRGMTLIELAIALGLLAIIMTAAFPLVDGMMSRFQTARDHSVAMSLCQARIERARGVPYSTLLMMVEEDSLVDDFGAPASPSGRFKRSTEVAVNSPAEGLTTMTVKTYICVCSRWGWRKVFHPYSGSKYVCHFTDEHEEMAYLFTEYSK